MSNIILTGATGNTGRYFIKLLDRSKYRGKIIVLSRNEYKKKELNKKSNLDVHYIYCDINKINYLNKTKSLFKNSIFLHIAGINYSKKILKFCLSNKIKWLIAVHTSGRFSKYKSEARKYISIDKYLLKNRNKIGVTLLYPTMIYGTYKDGNIHKLVSALQRFFLFFPVVNKGSSLIQPVYFKDLSKAYFQIIKNQKKTYNKEYILAGKKAIKYIEVLNIISKFLRKKFFFININLSIILIFYKILHLLFNFKLFNYEMMQRMQENRNFSISPAINDFKYNPLEFKKGLKIAMKTDYTFKKNYYR